MTQPTKSNEHEEPLAGHLAVWVVLKGELAQSSGVSRFNFCGRSLFEATI
jgi:hypothetical protein